MRKIEKLWTKRKDLIRSKTDNSDYYDEKYIKIKFELNNDLLSKEALELRNIMINVSAVFYEKNKS